MRPDDRIRLQHIADALRLAARFAEGHDRLDLAQDEMLGYALRHVSKSSARRQAGSVPRRAVRSRRFPGPISSACDIASCMPMSISTTICFG
jgi:hypothetical protein